MDVEEVHVGIQEHESSAPMTVQSDDESEEELDAYAFDIDLYPAGDEGTGFVSQLYPQISSKTE